MPVKKIPCTIMRAGTSKGVFLYEKDLPQDPKERELTILKIFGSPDARQIDGLGGADALTSKVAIIAPSTGPDHDVRYTYAQVAIDQPRIHTKGICGNISSGVGPFAIDEGLVEATEPFTKVRVFNTNTNKVFVETVPVKDGKAEVYGDYTIDGVPGTGAEVELDFSATAGAITGKLLPTGNVIDLVEVPGFGKIEMSIVDCGTTVVFIRAKDVGMTGTETPYQVDSDKQLLEKLEMIRGTAASMLGFCGKPEEARLVTANSPHMAILSPATDYLSYLNNDKVERNQIDFVSRLMFMQKMHKTYPGTGSFSTAIASLLEGTIANEMYRLSEREKDGAVAIGHPAGILKVGADLEKTEDGFVVKKCSISRTARRIMDGYVYIRL